MRTILEDMKKSKSIHAANHKVTVDDKGHTHSDKAHTPIAVNGLIEKPDDKAKVNEMYDKPSGDKPAGTEKAFLKDTRYRSQAKDDTGGHGEAGDRVFSKQKTAGRLVAKEETLDENDPCWKDYKMVGMKKKDGKPVPNCVPEEAPGTEARKKIENVPRSTLSTSTNRTKHQEIKRKIIEDSNMSIYKHYGIEKSLIDAVLSVTEAKKTNKLSLEGGKTKVDTKPTLNDVRGELKGGVTEENDDGWYAHKEMHGSRAVSKEDWKKGWRLNRDGKRVQVNKEEVEQIDELKAATVAKYSIKASAQGDKRAAGIKMADEKLRKRDGYSSTARVAAEEVEQIDELDRDGIVKRYSKVANDRVNSGEDKPEKRAAGRLLAGKKRWGGTGGIPAAKVPAVTREEVEDLEELDRNQGGILDRYTGKTRDNDERKAGRDLALKKRWGDKKYGLPEPKVKAVTREEVEELDERNAENKFKKDLYVTKKGVEHATKNLGFAPKDHASMSSAFGHDKPTERDNMKALLKDYKRRGRAVTREEVEDLDEKSLASLAPPYDKVTHKDVLVGKGVLKKDKNGKHVIANEEVEELDEISGELANNYKKKSSQSLFNLAMHTKQSPERDKKIVNRAAGMERAEKSIDKDIARRSADQKKKMGEEFGFSDAELAHINKIMEVEAPRSTRSKNKTGGDDASSTHPTLPNRDLTN